MVAFGLNRANKQKKKPNREANKKRNDMDTIINPTYTSQFVVNVDNPTILKTIKSLVKQLKGVNSIKEVTPKVKMSEAEFYEKIEAASRSAAAGHVYRQQEGESINNFVNRLLCTD